MKNIYKIMFFVSLGLTIAAVIITAIFGLKFGVDFKGGALMELAFGQERPSAADLSAVVSVVSGVDNVSVSQAGERGLLVRLNNVDEETHQAVLKKVSEQFNQVTENRFDSVGPTLGGELKRKSITAIAVLLIVITSYIALVFKKMSRVLSPWAMGLAAVIALAHDIIIPLGVFAILGRYLGIEITGVFVAAALTILGYSLSDSVVVFDRVRENVLRLEVSGRSFGELVHRSVMQTLVRSLNTTFTTILSLAAIYFFGGESIKYFSLALIIGIFSGAYSSIFVASPILVWLSGKGGQTARA